MSEKRVVLTPLDKWILIFLLLNTLMGLSRKANIFTLNLIVAISILIVSFLDRGVEPFRFLHYLVLGFSSIPLYIAGREVEIVWAKRHYDAIIVNIEKKIFKTEPSIFLLRKIKSPFIGEILGFSYFSFFLQFLLLGLPFYFLRESEFLPACFFAVFTSLTGGFLISTLFPVLGPRFFLKKEIYRTGVKIKKDTPATNGYIFAKLSQKVIRNMGKRGGAMPSLHAATNMIFTLFAFKFSFELGLIWFIITLFLGIGAVQNQFHYISDILAGYIWGIIFFLISPLLLHLPLF